MFLILDAIAILIFVIAVIRCRSRGFFRSFFGTLKVAIAIVVAYIFRPAVAYYFRTGFVEKAISNNVADRIHSIAQKTAEGFNLEKLFSDMPAEFTDIMSRYGADSASLGEQFGAMTGAAEESVTELAKAITDPIVHTVSDILAYAALFLGSMIILTVVIWLGGLIMELPILSTLDKGLGLLFGIISGALLVWVFCNLVAMGIEAISVVKPGILGNNVVENTYIIRWVSENLGFGFASK
ncbi:MAG: CvpA family protein [Eubacteriales bacterium]